MKKNKKSQTVLSKKSILGLILAVVLVLLIAQITFDVLMSRRISHNNGDDTTQLIISAVDNLNRPVPLDALTGKVYIANEHLTLPAMTKDTGDTLLYRASTAADTNPAELNFTTSQIVSAAKSPILGARSNSTDGQYIDRVFSHVPNLQACARGIHIVLGDLPETDNSLKDLGIKTLKDGRKVHFYQEANCSANLDDLAAYLKQVESY